MYLDHFGFKEEPFRFTPDPKYFYTSPNHIEVLSCLQYAIEYKKGFAVLIGEAGSGKTTIGHVLLKKLDPSVKVAMITNTHLNERELIYAILNEFGESTSLDEKCILMNKLNTFLIKELSKGGNPVLIIDEAQNLSPRVLEEVRMLANLETESEKLVQIILMGQPELERILGGEGLVQLQQRFSVITQLNRLSLHETKEYVQFRIQMAEGISKDVFTRDSLELIYEETSGIPRLINILCDACLVNAYALDKKSVDSKIVREAIEERRHFFNQGHAKVMYNNRPNTMNSEKGTTGTMDSCNKSEVHELPGDPAGMHCMNRGTNNFSGNLLADGKMTENTSTAVSEAISSFSISHGNADKLMEGRQIHRTKRFRIVSMPEKSADDLSLLLAGKHETSYSEKLQTEKTRIHGSIRPQKASHASTDNLILSAGHDCVNQFGNKMERFCRKLSDKVFGSEDAVEKIPEDELQKALP